MISVPDEESQISGGLLQVYLYRVLRVVFATLALQLQHNLLGSFCLETNTSFMYSYNYFEQKDTVSETYS